MTIKHRTKGFIFGRTERSDSDIVFDVFTKDFGKIEIFAKAIRKIDSKLKSGADLFFLSELEFIEGKNRKTLTDAVLINKFQNMLLNLEKLGLLYKVSKLLNDFLKGQTPDEASFNFVLNILEKIEDNNFSIKNPEMAYYFFAWNFISGQGYKPEVFKCVKCSGKLDSEEIYFSYSDGGAVCKKCFENKKETIKINSDVVKLIRIMISGDVKIASKIKAQPSSCVLFRQVSENSIRHFMPQNV